LPPLILPTTIYVDEAGFTGDDLLSKEQPYFVMSGVAGDEVFATEFIRNFRERVPTQGTELKGSNYAKSAAFEATFRGVLKSLEGRCRVVVADKRYVASSKFFEYAIEPGVKQNNKILYENDFHRFVANFFYFFTLAEDVEASSLLEKFISALRGGPEALTEFGKALEPKRQAGSVNGDPLAAMIKIAQRTWLSSHEEMTALIGPAGRLKWVLDATTNCMASLMRDFSTPDTVMSVIYDSSKPMAEAGGFFDVFVNRPELTTTIAPLGDRPIGFNLAQPMVAGDSKAVVGIQVADIAAGIVNRLAKDNRLDAEKEVLIPILSDECLFPDPSYIDLDTRAGQKHAIILSQLAASAGTDIDIMSKIPWTYALLEEFDPRDGVPSPEQMAAWEAKLRHPF